MSCRAIIKNCDASTAAEFAMVLPLLLILLFGIIDGGRWLWAYNQAEKATQAGARFAVVTSPLPGGLATADYLGVGGLTQGDVIPASDLGKINCGSAGCCVKPITCTTPYPDLGTFNSNEFTAILARMQAMDPAIKAENVIVSYEGSGLGYAGNPNGPQISPIVTVRLTGLQFQPITSLLFATINMPDLRASLTAEDLHGSESN